MMLQARIGNVQKKEGLEKYNIGGNTSYKIKYILKNDSDIKDKKYKDNTIKIFNKTNDVTNQIPNSNKFRKQPDGNLKLI